MSYRGIEGPYGMWGIRIDTINDALHAPVYVCCVAGKSVRSTDTTDVYILYARDVRGGVVGDAYKDGDANMQEALQWFADIVGVRLDTNVVVYGKEKRHERSTDRGRADAQ